LATQYTLTAKTQDQIIAIIQDATVDAAGSDDLIWIGSIKVETPVVELDPIQTVGVGEPLIITGTSNRKDGFAIIITVKGPTELTPQTVYIKDGTFNATFDTTDAKEGTYIVKADDGDGHTDEATVTIRAAPAPTPTPTPAPVTRRGGGGGAPRDTDGDGYSDIQELGLNSNPKDPCDPYTGSAACLAIRPPTQPPAATPAPTVVTVPPPAATPTSAPAPSATEEPGGILQAIPGFEVVFAVAGLLAIAYLVLRRKR
jgi:PGF-CTERM protein